MRKSLNKKEITGGVVATKKVARAKSVPAVKPKAIKKVVLKPKKLVGVIKPPKKTVVKKNTAPKTPKTKKQKSVFEEPVEVAIPSTASLRLLEKVEIYKQWYQLDFPEYVSKTARVAGYSFVLLGALFASFSYLNVGGMLGNSAALVCSGDICENIPDSDLPAGAPMVTFNNSIPASIANDIDFSLELINAAAVTTYVVSVETGKKTVLTNTETVPGNMFRYLIKTADLSSGSYVLFAEVQDKDIKYRFTGSSFTVEAKVLKSEPEPAPEPVITEVEDNEVDEDILDIVSTSSSTSATDDSDLQEEEGEIDTSEALVTEPATEALPVSLRLEKLRESTFLKITTGNFAPSLVEVYTQTQGSGQAVFLGLATLVQSEWIFSLDALDLPHNDNFIFAEFTKEGTVYKTEGVTYNHNQSNTELPSVGLEGSLLVEKVTLALQSSALESTNREAYFTAISSSTQTFFNSGEEREFASQSLLSAITDRMQENDTTINSLLFKYAVAVQVGQDFVVRRAEQRIEEFSSLLATQIASDLGQPNNLTNLKTILALRFNKLKTYIQGQENNLAVETNGLTTRDTDRDGISDYDEIANFATNYATADSDFDSVLDSIEIINDSDALKADLSHMMSFNQTTDDINQSDYLSIINVSPLIVKNPRSSVDLSHYVITGKSIPDSYVNIVAGEPGVVGIIKTNSEGQFSYTLEKELTKGTRYAYLALPDSNGNLVATSKVYQISQLLGKQGAAANSADINISKTVTGGLNPVVTAGVGLLALGLILLLLSLSVRGRQSIKLPIK